MVFAIIRKSDNYVVALETNSRDFKGGEDLFEVQTDFKFTSAVSVVWWKYDGISSFTEEEKRNTIEEKEIINHTNDYTTILTSLGFTGDVKLSEITSWMDDKFAATSTLEELKQLCNDLFKIVGGVLATLAHGWKTEEKEE